MEIFLLIKKKKESTLDEKNNKFLLIILFRDFFCVFTFHGWNFHFRFS